MILKEINNFRVNKKMYTHNNLLKVDILKKCENLTITIILPIEMMTDTKFLNMMFRTIKVINNTVYVNRERLKTVIMTRYLNFKKNELSKIIHIDNNVYNFVLSNLKIIRKSANYIGKSSVFVNTNAKKPAMIIEKTAWTTKLFIYKNLYVLEFTNKINDELITVQSLVDKFDWILDNLNKFNVKFKHNNLLRNSWILYFDGIKYHRYIMGANSGMEIDHINIDPLDNRKSNLRFVTRSENILNQLPKIRNNENKDKRSETIESYKTARPYEMTFKGIKELSK